LNLKGKTAELRKYRMRELHNWNSSPDIIKVRKLRRMR